MIAVPLIHSALRLASSETRQSRQVEIVQYEIANNCRGRRVEGCSMSDSITQAAGIHLMAKPIGPLCNLD
jgi:hypothetical protein